MILSRLNDNGLRDFATYLVRLKEAPGESPPFDLLTNRAYSEELDEGIEIEKQAYASRYQLGADLVLKLADCDQSRLSSDKGLWAWLALLSFDELCPADNGGNRKPARRDNYILSDRHQDYHRHAIRTTYMLVREHGDTVRYMLSNPLSVRGEFTEQLTGRSYFLSCKGIMQAANLLYADNDRNTWKRGAASKRDGSVRRFGLVVRQFELTYDVISLGGAEIIGLLPKEFGAFLPKAA